MTILEAIAAALIKWLAGWLGKRQTAKAAAAHDAAITAAQKDSQVIRDKAAAAQDKSHAQTQQALDHLGADADQPLGMQSDDVNEAISATNGDVR